MAKKDKGIPTVTIKGLPLKDPKTAKRPIGIEPIKMPKP